MSTINHCSRTLQQSHHLSPSQRLSMIERFATHSTPVCKCSERPPALLLTTQCHRCLSATVLSRIKVRLSTDPFSHLSHINLCHLCWPLPRFVRSRTRLRVDSCNFCPLFALERESGSPPRCASCTFNSKSITRTNLAAVSCNRFGQGCEMAP